MKQVRVAGLILFVSILSSQPSGREQVGKLPNGSSLLSTGWRIQPVGTQVPVDTFPMSSALATANFCWCSMAVTNRHR